MGDVIRGPWPNAKHPAGRNRPSSQQGDDVPFKWRSQYPSAVEDRRAALLDARPRCRVCDIPFNPRRYVPRDLICRDCKSEAAQDPDDQGGLF